MRPPSCSTALLVALSILILPCWLPPALAAEEVDLRGLYLPVYVLTERRLAELSHYAKQAGVNAFILHVKDPRGGVFWDSQNRIARQIGAVQSDYSLGKAIATLKREGIRPIAKIDVFADSLLASSQPQWAVMDSKSKGLWADKNGLHWTNPYEEEVWDYNIDLALELVALGFVEIQFDYTRFPSNGILRNIHYPNAPAQANRSQAIAAFLQRAYGRLKPHGVVISVDLFGLTAWKRDDLGVGQVLEEIAPHVDVLCPMLYPSHFPAGFQGWQEPNDHPAEIVRRSMAAIRPRLKKEVRPWLQGFWYTPEQIQAQIEVLDTAKVKGWAVWNSAANYGPTFAALATIKGITYTKPTFYPGLAELRPAGRKILRSRETVINYTDYEQQYSVLSLEATTATYRSPYSFPYQVLATLDEAVIDTILHRREIKIHRSMSKGAKVQRLAGLFTRDIKVSPRSLRPQPFFIDWGGQASFSLTVPGTIIEKMEGQLAAESADGPAGH